MDSTPDLSFDGSLPIHGRAAEIEELLRLHPVVILAGETGSGKSTQLPKLLLRAGFGKDRPIAITQPRRVAALSLARRVAEEMRSEGTAFVGHKVRFDNRTTRDTRVVFATDGAILAELGSDPLLSRYDAIVVDEAHERNLNVDFLIGVLRRIRERRPEFRIVVASATIDTDAFAKAFADPDGTPAPVVLVEGRTFPVDILYRDELVEEDDETLAERAASACREMMELSDGDLLCFLPGEKEIRETARELEKSPVRHTEIVPLFGRLSASDQDKVFHPGIQAEDHPLHQRGGDLRDRAADPDGGGHGARQALPVHAPHAHQAPAGGAHLAGIRPAARRTLRPHRTRNLSSPLFPRGFRVPRDCRPSRRSSGRTFPR
jgi:ATP-dependent helicase HrpA